MEHIHPNSGLMFDLATRAIVHQLIEYRHFSLQICLISLQRMVSAIALLSLFGSHFSLIWESAQPKLVAFKRNNY